MLVVPHFHRREKILRGVEKRGGAVWSVAQPGEHAGELGDVLVGVGWNREAVGVESSRAILIEFPQADGKQLHDFASIIFIGKNVVDRIGFPVLQVAEIKTHAGMKRDVEQQVAVIPKRVFEQHVVIIRHADRIHREGFGSVGYHQNLTQRVSHALPQRIGQLGGAAGDKRRHPHGAVPPRGHFGVGIKLRNLHRGIFGERLKVSDRPGKLVIDPCRESGRHQRLDIFRDMIDVVGAVLIRAEGCLHQKSRRLLDRRRRGVGFIRQGHHARCHRAHDISGAARHGEGDRLVRLRIIRIRHRGEGDPDFAHAGRDGDAVAGWCDVIHIADGRAAERERNGEWAQSAGAPDRDDPVVRPALADGTIEHGHGDGAHGI